MWGAVLIFGIMLLTGFVLWAVWEHDQSARQSSISDQRSADRNKFMDDLFAILRESSRPLSASQVARRLRQRNWAVGRKEVRVMLTQRDYFGMFKTHRTPRRRQLFSLSNMRFISWDDVKFTQAA